MAIKRWIGLGVRPVSDVTNVPPSRTDSQESGFACWDTLFHDFRISATSVYNHYRSDEEENRTEERGDRRIDEMPRLIRVRWTPAPLLQERVDPERTWYKRHIDPVKFSLETEGTTSHNAKGISFSPDHLQAEFFGVVRDSLANGYMEPGVVRALLESGARTVRAAFADPAIGGALDPGRVQSASLPHEGESIIAVAQSLPNLEVMSRAGFRDRPRSPQVPSFASPPDVDGTEYVGYILEKYELGPNGAFALVEEVGLPSPLYSEYHDFHVVYGGTYRYRLRTVVRWTRRAGLGPLGDEPFVLGRFGTQTQGLAFHRSSYFAGEWSPWAYAQMVDDAPPAAPDEFIARPESRRRRVCLTVRVPDDPKGAVSEIRILRRERGPDGRDVGSWTLVHRGPARNTLFYDDDVDFVQSGGHRYIYAAQSVTRHGVPSQLTYQLVVALNAEHRSTGELPVDVVRRSRAEAVGLEGRGFVVTAREMFDRFGRTDENYVVRVESLDTGERRDVGVWLSYENQPYMVRSVDPDDPPGDPE